MRNEIVKRCVRAARPLALLQSYIVTLLLCHFVTLPIGLFAQEVTVMVTPVQQVLPPQAGQYVDNPGRFFTIQLFNNTDEQQLVHLGLQIEQRFPDKVLWVSTNVENLHIPRQPIVLQPNQHKALNSIEMRHLFDHFDLNDIYIRDGRHLTITDNDFGLMPEGEYEAFVTAYKWDPELTVPVPMSAPNSGNTIFNICYEAEPPKFLSPAPTDADGGFGELQIVKVDKNNPTFTWIAPTLNCNASAVQFEHSIRIVELGSLQPDEAMSSMGVPVFLEKKHITGNTYRIDPAYVLQMIESGKHKGKVFAMQITASTPYFANNSINFSLLKNEGKSPIMLFQLIDPAVEDDDYNLTLEGSDADTEEEDSLYIFEQPMLTAPTFSGMMGRKIYYGEDVKAEWRKAWFAGGTGEEQDTVQFKYTLALYTGNSADTREAIFASKPIIKKETKELKDTIKWDELKDKITLGDYFYIRVTAEATNEKSIRMLPDSLNFIDFALSTHFDETYHCGQSTANVSNKTLISKKPDKNTKLTIGAWTLTFDDQYDQVEFDKDKKTLKGTGWINWSPGSMSLRIAVKFDALKVNTDNVVFDGTCKTYPKSENKLAGLDYTSEQFVDSLFSSASLDDIFGNMALPEGVQDKINNFVEKDAKGEAYNLAKGYNLGKYYSAYKKAENVWNNWQQGNLMDVYFPAEIPEDIKKHLPKDFNVQIANMSFSPSAAVMNVIGEIALPNSDIFEDQDVLVFGAPRLCVEPDRFFPEDGVLTLLSNFAIKDPSSDFRLIFKAPSNPLDPDSGDGCFIRWENDEFDALGMQIAMSIPNTKRFIDGKVNDDIPALADLSATIYAGESACDFLATGTLTPFEVVDLPGWTFGPEKDVNEMRIIFDHHLSRNGDGMPTLDEVKKLFPSNTFNEDLCGTYVKNDWDAWQGLYVSSLAVGFPKFAVFGNGEEGLSVGTRNMLIDASGVTCQVFADNILDAETGSLGGWKFTIADATVDIVQNNFDNCVLHGGFGVPLLGKAADDKADAESKSKGGPSKNADDKKSGGKDDKADKQENDFNYTCQIRHLTKPGEVKYEAWSSDGKTKVTKTRKEYTDDRLAYLFTTELVGDLSLNFFLADLKLHDKQTFLLVESVDKEDGTGQDTQVELCLAGDITIAGTDNVNSRLAKQAKKIGNEKLPLRLPGIHFAKMRLSNRKLSEWKDFGIDPKNTHAEGLKAQEAQIAEWKKSALYVPLAGGEELELSKECYFNYGEWSLASDRKKIGPFSFNLTKFKPSLSGDKLGLSIAGGIGLVEDKICVDAGITITSTLHKQGSVSEWYLSDGDVEFDSLSLDLDFTAIHMKGTLKIGDDGKGSKGYAGELDMDITGLFGLKCKGGYFKYTATEDDKTKMRENAKTLAEAAVEQAKKSGKGSTDYNYYYDRYVDNDTIYSWGYFMASLSSQMLRIDPVVITRIAGGFYFNCRPTPGGSGGSGDPKKAIDKFSGDPKPYYGMIGVAFGMGMAASSGESTLKADLDLLVVYDRKNSCLSTFMFNGDCEAVGGIIKADVSLIYENAKNLSGQTTDRYLCLNITVEGSFANNELGDMVKKANEKLEAAKAELDKFQDEVQGVANELLSKAPYQGLGELSNTEEGDKKKELTAEEKAKKEAEDKEKQKQLGTSGSFTVPLELKITWVKNSETYSTPKWHLYVGQPAKDKRCRFILLDFKSKICSAELGADAYLCLGNELPDGGALPEIPSKITEFLTGHKNAGTDMGADMTKVNNSRKNAVRKLLDPNSCEGGVMIGASAWGGIKIDLGLIYGSLEAIAGFDAAFVHYGNTAICMNSFSEMGKNGWYAMGQLYAYLGADLGVRIKIGSLIDEEVSLIKAGIGGLLEIGLPNPTWVEGQARVKMSFLGGLFSLNKKFSFSAGDRCIPFQGNALDGFELFQGVNLGSDSLYQAWYKPEFAISVSDASRMTFTTNSSLGSHYRLVDPSYLPDVAESAGTGEADSLFNIYASRTYVFDMNQNTNLNNMKMGVRLFDLGDFETQLKLYSMEKYENNSFEPEDFYKALGSVNWNDVIKAQGRSGQTLVGDGLYGTFLQYLVSSCQARENTVCETSWVMGGRDTTYPRTSNAPLHHSETASFDEVVESNNLYKNSSFGYKALKNPYKQEVNVSFRESKGNFFHLSNMDLQPNHCYVLVLMADAYEIENGKRVWCQYVNTDGNKGDPVYIKWRQSKLWFFRTKSEREEAIQLDSVRTLTPYVALAYPSVDGTRVQSGGEGYTTAYINDIMHPTIALNRRLFNDDTKQRLQWVLTAYKADEFNTENPDAGWHQTQTRDVKIIDANNCVNLEPASAFNRISDFTSAASKTGYDFSNEIYHLQLTYTYHHVQYTDATHTKIDSQNDSTRAIVDLWLTAAPHDVTISGMSGKQDDSWKETTNAAITGEILPYSLPFVGARPTENPVMWSPSDPTDEKYVYINFKSGNTPWRLMDPYLYFAYLSKYTFIGDRHINSYAFDDAYIPFASESLIFERNGTVVNSDFIKNEESKSLWELRTEMYDTWNTWYFNNPESTVEWPLPSTAKTAGGLTIANQDRKVATVTPLNLMLMKDYKEFRLAELAMDFAAPYYVAEMLNGKLRQLAGELWTRFTQSLTYSTGGTLKGLDSNGLNEKIKLWNSLHRGQYVEIEYRGVTVRVPYYQLPLIFGGCFSGPGWPTPHYKGVELSTGDRGFTKSIGAKEQSSNIMNGEGRWAMYPSNLLFFRLLGNDYSSTMAPEAFGRFQSQYSGSYPNPRGSDNQMIVEHDDFQMTPTLANVTKFKAMIYRVDSYDLTTGEYRMLSRGGGPYKEEMEIGAGKNVTNMADLYGLAIGGYLLTSSTLERQQMQAIYTADNKTMTILFSDNRYTVNSSFDGHTITNVWAGTDFDKLAWTNPTGISQELETVVFDKSLANANLKSTANWFNGCRKLKTLKNLKNLNTSNVTDMSNMFAYCESLTGIDFADLDSRNVTNMSGMLRGCTKVNYYLLKNLNTSKVTDMSFMFADCPNVTIPENFDTRNVTTMESMFENGGGHGSDLEYLNTAKVKNMRRMFYGCRSTVFALDSLTAENVTNTEEMFANTSFRTLKWRNFHANKKVTKYENMFAGMNTSNLAYIYIAWDLKQEIKDQLPMTPSETTPPVQVLHVLSDANQEQLLFLVSDTEYKAGFVGNIVGKNTYQGYTVKSVWNADQMQNYSTYPAWNSVAANVKRIIIDPSFTWSPKTMQYWFAGFSNAYAIDGLNNLNTKNVQLMNNMFAYCSTLRSLDLSSFSTEKVTRMDRMFDNCKELTLITVGDLFTTQNVQDMSYMFNHCEKLQKLTTTSNSLAKLDTRSAQNMSGMFSGCNTMNEWLSEAVKEFQTDRVTDMSEMFWYCSSVKELDLTSFNTEKVTSMNVMFQGCQSVELINLLSFKTPSLTSAANFGPHTTQVVQRTGLGQSSVAEQLAAGDIVHTGGKAYIYVPYDISTLIYPGQLGNASRYPNVKVIYPAKVLLVGSDASELIFTDTTTPYKVGDSYYGKPIKQLWSDMNLMYNGNPTWVQHKTITTVTFEPAFAQIYPTSMEAWFKGLDKLQTINGIEYLSTSSVKTMAQMFAGCSSLKEVDLSHFSCNNVTTMSEMFSGCSSLSTINLGKLNSSVLTTTASMFEGCTKLYEVTTDGFKAPMLTDMSAMFSGCTSLFELDFSSLKTSSTLSNAVSEVKLSNMERTFNRCVSLTKLTIGRYFDLSNVASCSAFYGVTDLMVVAPETNRADYRADFIDKLGFVDGTTGYFYGLSDVDATTAVPQVIWTEDNSTLTFFNGKEYPVGSSFRGQTVTSVWKGDDVTNTPDKNGEAPWTQTVSAKMKTVVIDKSFAEVRPKSMNYWFMDAYDDRTLYDEGMAYNDLDQIAGLAYLNTSEVVSMRGLFLQNRGLRNLDLSSFNTAEVKDMGKMFYDTNLKTINLGRFNTDKVEKMDYMFEYSSSLQKLDLTSFNTENVKMANNIFASCYASLKELIVGPRFTFDAMTSKATGAFSINYLNGSLIRPYNVIINTAGVSDSNKATVREKVRSALITKLGFDESKHGSITDVSEKVAQAIWTEDNKTLTFVYHRPYKQGDTFNNKTVTQVWSGTDVTATPITNDKAPWTDDVAAKVTTVVFDESFATVRPTSLACWFRDDVALTAINGIEHLNTSEATTMYRMFYRTIKMTNLNVTHFDTRKVKNMYYMFYSNSLLTALDVSSFNTSNVTDFGGMFRGCTRLTELNVKGFNTENAEKMYGMFYDCKSLTSLDVSRFITDNVTCMDNMFTNCSGLTSLVVSNFNTSNVTDFSYMFWGCSNVRELDVSGFDTQKATNLTYMFAGCQKLEKVDISGFKTPLVTRMDYMFQNCTSLTQVTGSTNGYDNLRLDGTNLKNINSMFEGCSAYKQYLNFYITPSTKLSSMCKVFMGCGTSWIGLFFDTSNVTDVKSLFQNCTNLRRITLSSGFSMEKVTIDTNKTNVFTGVGTASSTVLQIWVPSVNSAFYIQQLTKIGFQGAGITGTIQTYTE